MIFGEDELGIVEFDKPITFVTLVLDQEDIDAIVESILNHPIEGCLTFAQLNRLVAAALAGKSSGAELDAPVFRDVCDTVDRISATTDQDGNRLAVTVDGD